MHNGSSIKGLSDRSLQCLWEFDAKDVRALPPEDKDPSTEIEDCSSSDAIIREPFHFYAEHESYVREPFHSYAEHESYVSEIQLRRIVDKMANGSADQGTDGDEVMQKGEKTISKFSREALEIGAAVSE